MLHLKKRQGHLVLAKHVTLMIAFLRSIGLLGLQNCCRHVTHSFWRAIIVKGNVTYCTRNTPKDSQQGITKLCGERCTRLRAGV